MTTHYHEPLSSSDAGALAAVNERLGDLDAAIYGATTSAGNFIIATAGEDLGDRNAAYLDTTDGKVYLLDGSFVPSTSITARGFVDGTALQDTVVTLVISGIMDGFSDLTPLGAVYVDSEAGLITQAKPVAELEGNQIYIAEMGIAVAEDSIFVQPKPIQYALRAAIAEDEVFTLYHHADARPYKRMPMAYYIETEAGSVVLSYASSNQDSDVALWKPSPATYGSDQTTGGTAIGNMTASGGVAAAFDNNASTAAQKAGSTGTIGYDFGTGVTKTIRRYTIQESTSLASGQAPMDWTLEYSSNNSSWSVADTRSGETSWTDGEVRTFDVSTINTARYWRLNISDNNGAGNVAVGEIQMMEVATYADGSLKLAQTFTLASTETIGAVGLWLKKVGNPTGTGEIRIETTSSGTPTGTLADNASVWTYAESSLGTSYAEKFLSFGSSFSLPAGTYAIVITTNRTASESDYIDWGADGSSPSYSGGEMKANNSNIGKDAIFTVYDETLLHPSQIALDWWSSTHADIVNRYGDGSGNNLDTQTTFKCVLPAGFDDLTLIVELP